MKNYMKYKEGDIVKIIHSHSDDIGKTGIIREVRCSFCKIEIEGYPKLRNHCYGQFMKIEDIKEDGNKTEDNYLKLKK